MTGPQGQANTGRPVGPKTSSHQITITLGHAKYNTVFIGYRDLLLWTFHT